MPPTMNRLKEYEMKILLDAEINVLLNTKTKAASFTEIPPEQLILLHLQSTLQQLHGLLTPHCHVASDLLITPDTKRPHGVPSCDIEDIALASHTWCIGKL